MELGFGRGGRKVGGFQRRTKGRGKGTQGKKKGVKTGLNRAITRVPRSMYYLRTEVRRVISVTVVDAELNRDVPRVQK